MSLDFDFSHVHLAMINVIEIDIFNFGIDGDEMIDLCNVSKNLTENAGSKMAQKSSVSCLVSEKNSFEGWHLRYVQQQFEKVGYIRKLGTLS